MLELVSHHDVRLYYDCPLLLYLTYHGPFEEIRVHPIIRKSKSRRVRKFQDKKMSQYHQNFKYVLSQVKQGKQEIYQAILMYKQFITKINKLVKKEGKCKYGNYTYIPYFQRNKIKMSRNMIMEGTFNVYITCLVLDQKIDFFVISAKDQEKEILVEDTINQLKEDLQQIIAIKTGKKSPSPIYTRDCKICEWKKYCKKLAFEIDDLTTISGIGKRVKKEFFEKGIKNTRDLSQMNEQVLTSNYVSKKDIKYFILQAQSLEDNKTIIQKPFKFPRVQQEHFVDMELSPNHEFTWLIGCFSRDQQKTVYHPFIANKLSDEKSMYHKFIKHLFKNGNNFVLYHWSPVERHFLKKMAQKYNIPKEKIQKILDNSVDLFKLFKSHIILPVASYTLKNVANHLGFEWDESLMDGASSILLFEKWFYNKDKKSLERAISYNSDDCKALIIIKDYLEKTLILDKN